jgi:RNA polymerase sigma-70 factor (ECF subfamily)
LIFVEGESGLQSALSEHFSRLFKDLYRFAYRMVGSRETAEDIVQEAFLKMAKSQGQDFHADRTRRWMFVVVRNSCVDHFRRVTVEQRSVTDSNLGIVSSAPNPAIAVYDCERNDRIAKAVWELSPLLRETLILREFKNLNYTEIADIVGCSTGTVKSRLARARLELQQRLQPLMELSQ